MPGEETKDGENVSMSLIASDLLRACLFAGIERRSVAARCDYACADVARSCPHSVLLSANNSLALRRASSAIIKIGFGVNAFVALVGSGNGARRETRRAIKGSVPVHEGADIYLSATPGEGRGTRVGQYRLDGESSNEEGEEVLSSGEHVG